MDSTNEGSIILLPGMAADASLFEPQQRAFPRLVVPPWLPPEPREPLRDYARRMSRAIKPLGPSLVGGASFGGMVALEMAACLGLPACLLISAIRCPSEMPFRIRAIRPLARLGPENLAAMAAWASRYAASSIGRGPARQLDRLAVPGQEFPRWACWSALHWSPSPQARRIRTLRIHGSADRTFPMDRITPDVIVAGGGHLLTRTHPDEVNDFVRLAAARITP